MKTRYSTIATLALALAASVATFRLAAGTYYWIGSSGGDWASGDNWSLSEGGAPANTVPTGTDDVIFTDDATADISAGDVSVNNFTIQSGKRVCIKDESQTKKLAMGYSLSEAGTTLALAGATVLPQANSTSDTLNIYSGVEFVEGYTSGVYANSQRVDGSNKPARYVALRGPLSGKGTLKFINNNGTSRSRIYFYGDNSNFEGSVNIGGSNSNGATWSAAESGSAKAKWQVAQTDNSSLTFGFTSGTIAFGSLETTGRITLAASSIISVQLGMDGDDSECGAQFVRGSNGGNPSFVKVGNNKVTYTGTFPADNNNYGTITLLKGTWAHGTTSLPKQGFKFTGGMLAIPAGVSIDPSAYIKNSTAAIIFDDEGTSRTWATALAESNGGGLEKKGSGTLTLSAVPLYTGTTTVSEGALVIPGGTTLAKLSVADGATLYVSGTDGQTITITEFAVGTTTDNVKAVAGSSLSWSGNTATISRSAATYTWTDATTDHNWATPGNWTINDDVATVPPMTIDTVAFPAEGAPWNVALSGDITVAAVRFNGNTTLSGAKIISSDITAASTDVTITLGNAAGFQNGEASVTLNSLSFAVTAASETPAVFYFNKAGNAKSFTLNNTCRFTGSGAVTFGTQFDNSGIEVRADMSDFAGTVNIPKATASAYRSDASINPAASSAKAIWNVDNGSKQSAFFANSGIYYFGSLKGSVSHNYQSVSGSAGYGYLMEIGSLGQDDELGGRYFSANYTSRIKEAQYHAILRKVGNGTLTFTGMEIARFEVNGGVLYCKSDSVFNTYWSTEEKTTTYSETLVDAGNEWHAPITFGGEGGTLKLDEAVTTDLSTNFVGSTKPIAIDDGNTDRTWSGVIDSSNAGGLTKKGTGTLTLTAAPAYTGLTTVEAGALVVPQGTELIVNALSAGTLTGATVTKYAYPENTTLVYDGTTRNYDSELDLSNVKTVDMSGVTLVNGTTYTIVSATAIAGYSKGAIEVVLPEGADATKWVLRKKGSSLVLAPKGGFLLIIQ